ncbi:MAG: 30S ribosomal protein THX [Bacteroidota bacterium]
MGKGDKRSKRGKIWRGSYGKVRPNASAMKKIEKQKREQKNETETETEA